MKSRKYEVNRLWTVLILAFFVAVFHTNLISSLRIGAQAAPVKEVLTRSRRTTDAAKWISLSKYRENYMSTRSLNYINWPREDKCNPAGSSSKDKALPWRGSMQELKAWIDVEPGTGRDRLRYWDGSAENHFRLGSSNNPWNGNIQNHSGDCTTRYEDGGTDTDTTWNDGLKGAWQSPNSLNGWASLAGSTSNMNSPVALSSSAKLNDCTTFGTSGVRPEAIWTEYNAVGANYMPAFFPEFDFGPPPPPSGTPQNHRVVTSELSDYGGRTHSPVQLKSHGTTLFRNEFTLSSSQIAKIKSTANDGNVDTLVDIEVIADDWFALYINGVFVGAEYNSTLKTLLKIPDALIVRDLLVEGANVIAVQVIDKAYFSPKDNLDTSEFSAGLCYSLNVNYPPNTPPTVTATGNCSSGKGVEYTVEDPDGDRHDAELFMQESSGGSWVSTGMTRNNRQPGSYEFNVSKWNDFEYRRFRVQVTDRGPAGQVINSNVRNFSGCVTAACNGQTINPSPPEVNEEFDVTGSFRVNGTYGDDGSARAMPYRVELSTTGTTPAYSNTKIGSSGAIKKDPQVTVITRTENDLKATNTFTVTWRLKRNGGANDGAILATCADGGGNYAVTKPYFKVYSGDVAAGVNSGCSGWQADPNARTIGWAFSTSGSDDNAGKGSAGQLGVFALGQNEGFISSVALTIDFLPKARTFANTGGTFGGNFGQGFCPKDYNAEKPASPANHSTADISSLSSGSYNLTSSPREIHGSIDNNKHVYIYVSGDVRITDNITKSVSWEIDEIPSFHLIVYGGNIYIDDDVTQLDGVFIAQPNTSGVGGQIITCSLINGIPNDAQMRSNCGKKLTIYGEFIASRVRLLRTLGTRLDSSPAHNRNLGKPAELFIYSPELWLAQPNPPTTSERYDSVLSLPPAL